MSNTKEEWIKVGIMLGMMPGGMPGEKNEKFSNCFEFFENVIFFDFKPIFHQKYVTLGYFWEGKKLMF